MQCSGLLLTYALLESEDDLGLDSARVREQVGHSGSGMTGEDWTDSWITGTDLGSSAVIASSLTAVNSVDSETDTAVLAALFLLSLRFNVGD